MTPEQIVALLALIADLRLENLALRSEVVRLSEQAPTDVT